MKDETFTLKMYPRDLLFCKDACPMESSWTGCGGFLPGPNTFHGAVTAEYCRKFPEELKLRYAERKGDGLRTSGPFLFKDKEVYFPTPLDIIPGNNILELRKLTGYSDFPSTLEYALFAQKADKKGTAPYISLTEMEHYLENKPFQLTEENVFFDREARPGITISPDKRTAEKGKFYYAEYLRLKPDVALLGECILDEMGNLGKLFEEQNPSFPLGGQQTMVYVDAVKGKKIPRPNVKHSGIYVKWVLLTPSAFWQGWIPDFVNQVTGKVTLMAETGPRPDRLPGENRSSYRKRIAKKLIDAKLIAARVGKHIAISGWKQKGEGGGCPRATHLFVPAGSVYYFRTATEDDAQLLISSLNSKAYSAIGGRAGYGIGICGKFTVIE